jgi:site-specific DNA recombinase
MNYIPPPSELSPGSSVCCYLRDSGGDGQEQSTAQQRRVIDAYCVKHGLILAKVFEDEARTGGTTKGRNEFFEMIELAQSPQRPDGLLVWNYARFARDMDDSAFYRALIRKKGMAIHSLTDPIPPGEFSRVIEALIDYSNDEKRRQTSRDVKRGLNDNVQKGFTTGGPAARGYLLAKEVITFHRDGKPRLASKLEIDPDLGPLVSLAFNMRADEKSYAEIMQATHGKLYKTKNCFRTFFTNKTYLGIGKCGDIEIENHHPALVDQATWQAVQEIQKRSQRRVKGSRLHPKRINYPSLLSGLAVCIHCGTPVIREVAGKKKWAAYLCGKKRSRQNWHVCEGRQINASKADKIIVDTVLEKILTPEFIAELLDEIRALVENTDAIHQEEARVKKSLLACEKAIHRLIDTIETTESPAAIDRLKDRENERARLNYELNALQARKRAATIVVTEEALRMVLDVWAGEIEEARQNEEVRNLQSLLRRFVTKIELGYNLARIWYTYPVDAFSDNTLSQLIPSGPLNF